VDVSAGKEVSKLSCRGLQNRKLHFLIFLEAYFVLGRGNLSCRVSHRVGQQATVCLRIARYYDVTTGGELYVY
jgi:hypothetical protein